MRPLHPCAQVLLLLRSSDRVADDLCHAFDSCAQPPAQAPPPVLVLRKWAIVKPENEFRCGERPRLPCFMQMMTPRLGKLTCASR